MSTNTDTAIRGLTWALAAGLLAAGAAVAQTEIDERMAAARDGAVEIENISGSVEVTGWDRAEVEVTGTLGKGVERLRFERIGDRIEIEAVYPKAGESKGSHLIVRVPEASDLEVDAVSAGVTAAGVHGELQLQSVSGSIEAESNSTSIDLESVSGDVELKGHKATVEATSVSGDVELELMAGDVEARTVSGEVDLHIGELANGDLESVSGDVNFVGDVARGGRLEIESHSGDVDLELSAGIGARVQLETYSGSLRSEFGGQAGDDDEWEFVLGDGQARIEVSTFSGNVEVKKGS